MRKNMETNLSLVRLNTQDVSKAIPVTDTKIISENLGVQHRYIKKHLKTHKEYFERFGLLVAHGTESTGGRPEEVFELNEQQATFLITLMKNTKEVTEFKFRLVQGFYLAKSELQARTQTRAISKEIRKSLTDTIKDKVSDAGNFKKYAYGNYSKLVYKVVTGMDVKKYKALHGLKEKDNIRDFFSLEEIEKVQELESKIAYYIEMRTDITGNDKETYAEVKKYVDSLKEQNKLLA